jgi:hypothetical protein
MFVRNGDLVGKKCNMFPEQFGFFKGDRLFLSIDN